MRSRRSELAASGYTDVCGEPTLSRALQKRAEPTHLGLLPFRSGGLHLTFEGQEALMQRDLLSSGLVAVVEFFSHLSALTVRTTFPVFCCVST